VAGALLDRLSAAPARAGSTRILAIDGQSGTGKTTLGAALQSAAPTALPVLHLDDIYPGWDGLAAVVPRLVEWILQPLAQGRPARFRRYDWLLNEYAEWHDVPAAPMLVIEGAGSGSLPAAPYLSLLVYLQAPEAVRFERAMARDGEAYRPHWDRWASQEREHFAVHRPGERADVVLDAEDPQAPGVP
jgi:uridine kinase